MTGFDGARPAGFDGAQPAEIEAAAREIMTAGPSAPIGGRDPINRPMIHNWVEAMGDANPVYVDDDAARAAGHPGVVAPPAMAQVWTMRGLHGVRADDDPLGRATELFDAAGYTSVVATNCDTVYHRYTRPGEEVTLSAELIDVAGPKQTALGEGWFFTTRNTWRVGDETVAEMNFRILKFRPAARPTPVEPLDSAQEPPFDSAQEPPFDSAQEPPRRDPAPEQLRDRTDLDPSAMIRPTVSRDTAFFWDGVAAHELRIQRQGDGTLRHPPIPATWKPRGDDGEFPPTDYVVASGRGTVYSFVVHHAPKVPGRSLPFVVALVELEEGVRMLGELRGVDPADVQIGMDVEVEFLDFDDWTLYAWRAR
ncbi:bifunctional MaoC family dehydratase N-terminal/OB-fold nucleic acid binding domain-containing protein [Gordonia sp. (in: high G+C Gram-positive bacteria)]|uniref:bifunctional MaoC family dehydratase N-terminal/OB-fold nucleic acid binding domain-containing protein n=1 Tax=Gordonia sp. (in: high G+C Gram-positive bacteria) TaxID=84139 RepID=UPI0026034461|nr:bifunctional MaoC family dehydratase N-terminal/OB-fold nucleic acid binding domain-containing protein [Gordonia sp. (in: high G+C Gram-positive bacteria)]